MPHHIEDGDNADSQTCHVAPDSQSRTYVPEVIQVVSKVLILTKKELRRMCIWWGMPAWTLKMWINK